MNSSIVAELPDLRGFLSSAIPLVAVHVWSTLVSCGQITFSGFLCGTRKNGKTVWPSKNVNLIAKSKTLFHFNFTKFPKTTGWKCFNTVRCQLTPLSAKKTKDAFYLINNTSFLVMWGKWVKFDPIYAISCTTKIHYNYIHKNSKKLWI